MKRSSQRSISSTSTYSLSSAGEGRTRRVWIETSQLLQYTYKYRLHQLYKICSSNNRKRAHHAFQNQHDREIMVWNHLLHSIQNTHNKTSSYLSPTKLPLFVIAIRLFPLSQNNNSIIKHQLLNEQSFVSQSFFWTTALLLISKSYFQLNSSVPCLLFHFRIALHSLTSNIASVSKKSSIHFRLIFKGRSMKPIEPGIQGSRGSLCLYFFSHWKKTWKSTRKCLPTWILYLLRLKTCVTNSHFIVGLDCIILHTFALLVCLLSLKAPRMQVKRQVLNQRVNKWPWLFSGSGTFNLKYSLRVGLLWQFDLVIAFECLSLYISFSLVCLSHTNWLLEWEWKGNLKNNNDTLFLCTSSIHAFMREVVLSFIRIAL
jgi:hypothetical protein